MKNPFAGRGCALLRALSTAGFCLCAPVAKASVIPPIPKCAGVLHTHPKWASDAVAYGVVPRLYGRRPLRAVTKKLDEFQALGINVIWLSPLAAPLSDYGHTVSEPFSLSSDLGSSSDLHELIDSAHARKMRVILDFVVNAVSGKSKIYRDVQRRGLRSPYYYFFQAGEDGNVGRRSGQNLRRLNFDNPDVWRYELNAFRYWLKNFNADGFRAVGAWVLRQRAPKFWPWLNAQLKCGDHDLLLLAEGSARDPYYSLAGFDSAYDWTKKSGQWAWDGAFGDAPDAAARLRAAIVASEKDAPAAELIFRFLNNNDTGPRFITRYGVERTRVAAAMLMTLPGLPSLFTGDEVGAQFEPYEKTAPIEWRDSFGLREWYRRLIHLREAKTALRSRKIRFLDVAPGNEVLAYVRPGESGSKSILVLLNYGSSPVRFVLPQAEISAAAKTASFTELLTGTRIWLQQRRPSVSLAAHAAQILQAD